MTDDLPLTCDTHGKTIWEGHVICCVCSRLYARPQEMCRCGVRLQPKPDDSSEEFSARAICAKCFKERRLPDLQPQSTPDAPPSGTHPALVAKESS